MKQPASAYHELLNSVEALIVMNAVTLAEVAAVLLPEKPKQTAWNRTHEWIKQRKYPISDPDIVLRLATFSEAKERALPEAEYLTFDRAFRKITCERKPKP